MAAIPCRAQEPSPIRFARHPALSPDGKRLAFTYQGDLWTAPVEGGTARRLTVHEAHDQLPVWSPDGRWIAFSSNRAGGYDVWAMPSDGGEPTRLTFHSATDSVSDWSPDGSEILFSSNRETTRTSALYAVNVHTGRSRLIREDDMALSNARFTRDGQSIICTRGGNWMRPGYRGSGAANLLLVPVSGGPGRLITHDDRNERWPMPTSDSRRIYCVSDRSGAPNIVRLNLDGGAERPITHFRDGALFYPTLSGDGAIVVFERDFRLWRLDTATGALREIVLYAPSDYRINPERRLTLRGGVTEFALSPDGKSLAFVVRGEVFLMPASGQGEPVRLTETPNREEDIAWSPDGKSLALISDRTGCAELYVLDVASRRMRQITRLRTEPASSPAFAPDGKTIAFVRGGSDAELCTVPFGGGEVRTLVHDPSIGSPGWSPDSKWIVFERSKSHSAGTLADVFLVNVDDPKPVNITRYPTVNENPVWSRDGSRVFVRSNRVNAIGHVWAIPMQARAGGEGTDAADGKATFTVDLKDIHMRAARVTSGENAVRSFAVSPDGKTVLFTVGQLDRTDIRRIGAAGGEPVRLTQSGENASRMQFSPDGSQVFYLAGGSIRRLTLAGPSPTVTPLSFSGEMVVETRAELLQLFDEAWRKMRDGFYDPAMHGCDWNAVYERYRPIAAGLATREDFYTLFSLALGELNASHTGISAPGGASGPETASLGVALDDGYAGPGVRIRSVMPDGPAAGAKPAIKSGDVLTKVDGTEIATNERLFDLLEGRAGKQVEVTVLPGGSGEPRTVKLRPITGAAYRQLSYVQWVKQREEMTDTLSGGRLLYVHLNSMGAENLEKFKRTALGDAASREGLVLDLRFNGGGSIADEIFAVILNRVFGWRTIRGDTERSPAPLPSFTKPIVVLANEASLSNAEVFPWGFKALKLGKVVGMPTYGGVIGTGGTTLLDGSSLRMPAVGSFTLDGRNMENNGCPPDIQVEHTPEDIVAGRDRQLERAVMELLRQIGPPKTRRTRPPSAAEPPGQEAAIRRAKRFKLRRGQRHEGLARAMHAGGLPA
jgi:Tol biopolymer transport system component/C-terminal processing protease CtpA/Prc